jgi:hypothetical protein
MTLQQPLWLDREIQKCRSLLNQRLRDVEVIGILAYLKSLENYKEVIN